MSKRSFEKFEAKADIKEMLSDKIKKKGKEVASNSPSRTYERYQNKSIDPLKDV